MNKRFLRILQILGGLFICLIVAIFVLSLMVNSTYVQNKVLHKSTEMLSQKLNTKVEADSIHINLWKHSLDLYNVSIEDQQHRKMFEMDALEVDLDLARLMANQIVVEKAHINGIRAHVRQHEGEEPNYQFVLDSLKRDTPKDAAQVNTGKKSKLKFDIRNIDLSKIQISYNDINLDVSSIGADLNGNFQGKGNISNVTLKYEENLIHLGRLEVNFGERWKETALIEDLKAQWTAQTKKGPVETAVQIERLQLAPEDGIGKVHLTRLHYTTDNHQPRKNVAKPKRGAFDAGHLNVWADLELNLLAVNKDTIYADIVDGTVTDSITGFFIHDLKAKAQVQNGVAHLRDVSLKQLDTKIDISNARVQLPNKKKGLRLNYATGLVTIHTRLKDISQPFAPVLKDFTMPLTVTTKINGHDDGMLFSDIYIHSDDDQLQIRAKGGIEHFKDKYKLAVRFDVERMNTNSRKTIEIINLFAVKKLMMDQLQSLKTIAYKGSLGIYWKSERFKGKLMTQEGDLDFDFELDEENKYIYGNLNTKSFDVGEAFSVKSLKSLGFAGHFKVDFSKERTARMRKDKNGKLPIGEAHIQVTEIHLKKLKYYDIFADIQSDGAQATIIVDKPGNIASIGADILYTSTTTGTKVKMKPKLQLHLFDKKKEQIK